MYQQCIYQQGHVSTRACINKSIKYINKSIFQKVHINEGRQKNLKYFQLRKEQDDKNKRR